MIYLKAESHRGTEQYSRIPQNGAVQPNTAERSSTTEYRGLRRMRVKHI